MIVPPRSLVLGPFHLSPLGPDCCDADYVAVTSSEGLLHGLFGTDWPRGLTYAQNRADLVRHAREWDDGVAFAYVIRSDEGAYLGCAYVNPSADGDGGRVVLWLRSTDAARITTLRTAVAEWLQGLGHDLDSWPITTPA